MASVSAVFKNIGHFFATAVSKLLANAPKVEAAADRLNTNVDAAAPKVEAITAAIPTYGPVAVTIEQAGVMALGAIVGAIHMFGEAAKSKLLDVGLDEAAIDTAVAVYNQIPGAVKAIVSGTQAAA